MKNWIKTKATTIKKVFAAAYAFALMAVIVPTSVHATEPTSLQLNFDPAEMFTWAQMILDIMLPVLYITLGVSLAFIIIRALKSAFSG